MTKGERIKAAMLKESFSQGKLAKAVGITQPALSKIVAGKLPGTAHLAKIARVLGVETAWLTIGENPPAWADPSGHQRQLDEALGRGIRLSVAESPPHSYIPSVPLEIIGSVVAGDGKVDIAFWQEEIETVALPTSWKLVRVEGMSAYPVVYPRQFVLVDTARGVRPGELTPEIFYDLNNNIVMIQCEDGRAFLKRFCHAPGAPGDFVLASVDGGRSSPFLAPDSILVIVPVVGTIYRDPRRPMEKMNHALTVLPFSPN